LPVAVALRATYAMGANNVARLKR